MAQDEKKVPQKDKTGETRIKESGIREYKEGKVDRTTKKDDEHLGPRKK